MSPEQASKPLGHTAREGRPGPDVPPRLACAGHWPWSDRQPALLPGLSSSSALREWLLAARPLLLEKHFSCTPYLMQSVKSEEVGEDIPIWQMGTLKLGERKGYAVDLRQGQLQVTSTWKNLLRHPCWMTCGPKDEFDLV